MSFTLIEYYGKQNNSRCGYCKQIRSSHSHGMHAYQMSPQDYQDLIDRGWRRSGHYCYKPNNKITCCPSYTIRCDAIEFKLSKSHKKILKRMNKFLIDGKKEKTVDIADEDKNNMDGEGIEGSGIKEEPDIPNIPQRDLDFLRNIEKKCMSEGDIVEKQEDKELQLLENPQTSTQKETRKSHGVNDSRPPCKKAKQMRLERKKQKLAAKGIQLEHLETSHTNQNKEKSLREYINAVPENSKHKLMVKLVPSNKEVTQEELELFRKYQVTVHKDPPEKITREQFERFLVKSPLKNYKTPDGPPHGYGSYHHQYWLNDRLIAVGVVDILPYCISSVYFFYDPEFSFLSLGSYGSLIEIDLIRQLNENTRALKYYYMGFYIHSCPKMRYKGLLVPSYLLCPEIYTWHLLTNEIRTKLDQKKYQKFNTNADARDSNEFKENDINLVRLLIDGNTYTYGMFSQMFGEGNIKDKILEYGKLVGKVCAHRMFYLTK